MAKTIRLQLNLTSISQSIAELEEYKRSLQEKCVELCKRLAEIGLTSARSAYDSVPYDSKKSFDVAVYSKDNGYVIEASGQSVLFLEFGAGATYGYGHPQASQFGMGPGTYNPSSNNWNNPKGWYIPKSAGGGHTFGNPPSMAMYNAGKDMEREILRIAREVFES